MSGTDVGCLEETTAWPWLDPGYPGGKHFLGEGSQKVPSKGGLSQGPPGSPAPLGYTVWTAFTHSALGTLWLTGQPHDLTARAWAQPGSPLFTCSSHRTGDGLKFAEGVTETV